MGKMFDAIFDDLREPRLSLKFRVADYHRGGALRIENEVGQLLGHVEQVRKQEEIAHLWAASAELYGALHEAVEKYGKPGGPWNVPSDPGGWLDRARNALRKADSRQSTEVTATDAVEAFNADPNRPFDQDGERKVYHRARLPVLATDCDYEIVSISGVQGRRL